ncbi:oxygen-insensitive NADPH nitroreductase [Priestia aryabhattai]|uniref:oxygen-insensitive NADPH nitroreductase n=1 Tax=Priestia TaxID=2800373 RepID=UPI0008DCEB91|nr:oxygen-insensitive NADPH nitroreductase [Priestia aryabhattai]MBX9967378.1 oxygen-insensitive NADPH nitroreductase [Priestia aryabhattai]MBZ6487133.1 oxygen-insensitive NADPH nitroreductase [Priestia aryabhattai]MDH3113987.1 oxygen-insensitive NADPH nitroreductase [Priestia aryabhattai]MDH3127112.1 oxygen-insensitive NADPH nitroreductase [Priestia aryabhattai]MDH3132647.1 oxygen-insensitive NADPH nitroreductase [Priestia aryabhattai]
MNEAIRTIQDHRSIRQYTDEAVSDEHLDTIIQSAQSAASSINGQQVTIISVQDKEKKKKLSELAGNQAWIDQAPLFLIFCADFNRAKIAAELNDAPLGVTDGLESILVGATDAGISLEAATVAAESLGLGTVPIGGIRRKPLEVIELLDLPEYVFPVSGLVVGHPADHSAKKPRLPQAAVHHRESYNHDLKPLIQDYDAEMAEYMQKRTNGADDRNWSQTVSAIYKTIYYPEVRAMLEKQGFKFE